MNRIVILTPLIILLIICFFSLTYLLSGKDPNKPPSALLNKNVPKFKSSSLYNEKEIIKTIDIRNKKTLINFFASWCKPCLAEHPLLMEMKKQGIKIIGVNFRDDEENFKEWIKEHGNPFEHILRDDGTIAYEMLSLIHI